MTTTPTVSPAKATNISTKTSSIVEATKPVNPLRIRDTTSNHLWTVIGIENCEWTAKAVKLLRDRGENTKYIELNAEWQRRLVVEYNTRRIPAVFKGSGYFGSYDVLENYYKSSFIADSERF
jgi:glutaredoxin